MNTLKVKIFLLILAMAGVNTTNISAYQVQIADVIPFESISRDMNSPPNTGPQTPTVTSTTPNPTQPPTSTQNNTQLNSTGTSGLGSSTNSANKNEQDNLYNRSVNDMLNK